MNLSKDEILRLAREAGIDFDPRFGTAYTGNAQIERFSTICRADLVAENSQLREQNTELDKALRQAMDYASPQPSAVNEDLAMMARRLVLAIRRNVEDPHKDLTMANDCLKWLQAKGLAGSPLRESDPQPSAAPLVRELVDRLVSSTGELHRYYSKHDDMQLVNNHTAIAAAQQWLKENKHG